METANEKSVKAVFERPAGRAKRRFSARLRVRLLIVAVALVTASGVLLRSRAMQLTHALLPLPYAFVESPNCDDRPANATVNCVVLHATVEPTTQGTMDIFLNPQRKVSAHFVVGRDGRVVQIVRVEKRAWHAGASTFDGETGVNNFSVGIEIVNLNDGRDPYPAEQLEAVAGIIRFLRSSYSIPDSRIVSHAMIAVPPGRKSDPVGLDFEKVRALARLSDQPPAAARVPLPVDAPVSR